MTILTVSRPAEAGWLDQGLSVLETMNKKEEVPTGLPSAEIGAAFKEALHFGTEKVVAKLGSLDGFNRDATVHIPLPM